MTAAVSQRLDDWARNLQARIFMQKHNTNIKTGSDDVGGYPDRKTIRLKLQPNYKTDHLSVVATHRKDD